MKYYLIELNDYEQAVVTDDYLNIAEELAEEFDGFTGILVIREATEQEYNEYLTKLTNDDLGI